MTETQTNQKPHVLTPRTPRHRKSFAKTTLIMTPARQKALQAAIDIVDLRDPEDVDITVLEDDAFLIRCMQKKLCQAMRLGYNGGMGDTMNWMEKVGYAMPMGIKRQTTFYAGKARAALAPTDNTAQQDTPQLQPQPPKKSPRRGTPRQDSPNSPYSPRILDLLLSGLKAKRVDLIAHLNEDIEADISLIEAQYGDQLDQAARDKLRAYFIV